MSEYRELFGGSKRGAGASADDLERARELFAAAARPFLSSPATWLGWAVALPAAALFSGRAHAAAGALGVLVLWTAAILAAGAVEAYQARRAGALGGASALAGWALRVQGNLSLVAVVLSVGLLVVPGAAARLLPGLWLLLLGHSLFSLGGLAFRPLRTCGLVYQVGGVVSFLAGPGALTAFAAATALGNGWMAWSIHRLRGTGE